MAVELPARGIRVGGVTVGPGEARAVSIPLARRGGEAPPARAVPAWVAVGGRPGPRVSVVAALRGTEASAARAARGWPPGWTRRPCRQRGHRPRAAARRPPESRRALRRAAAFSGRGGRQPRRARGVLAVFRHRHRRAGADRAGRSAARPPRAAGGAGVAGRATRALAGHPVRRRADRGPPARPGTIAAAAAAVQVPVVELSAAWDATDAATADPLSERGARGAAALGVLVDGAPREVRPAAAVASPVPGCSACALRVRAPSAGYLQPLSPPGRLVRAREPLARLEPFLPGPAVPLGAPSGGLVIEAAPPGPFAPARPS